MESQITQRKQDINQISQIMGDINSLAKDLATETTKQGEKLDTLDTHVTNARDNAKEALGELEEASTH